MPSVTSLQTYAALVRGINVGGKNKLPMAELTKLLTTIGHEDIVTYIQSGNIVFRSATRKPGEIEREIETRIADTFGLKIAVVLRTRAELSAIAAASPFLDVESSFTKLHVVFLRSKPRAASVAHLDPDRSPGDRFVVSGREIYLHMPGGSARTKLTLDYFERKLGVDATARNWNTLLRLRDLAG
jgi:uncharacterized protein (DUF1697 family)